MSNIIKAVFEYASRQSQISSLWQWDYGQCLEIHGLDLPPGVEVHFTLAGSSADAIVRIGTTVDKVTTVAIPETYLEQAGTLVAYIYVSDTVSGQTEYTIKGTIKERPRPQAWDKPEDEELFRQAIETLNAAAERTEEAEAGAEAALQGAVETVAEIPAKVQEAKADIDAYVLTKAEPYVAMYDSVVDMTGQVEADREAVESDRDNVESMQLDVVQLHQEATAAAESATASRDDAKGYAQAADTSRQAAAQSVVDAVAAQDAAEIARTEAETAQSAAQTAKTEAETASTNAVTAKTEAETAKTASETARDQARQIAEQTADRITDTVPTYRDIQRVALVGEASGRVATCTDSADWPLLGVKMHGESRQGTTTGVQLLNPDLWEDGFQSAGITFSKLADGGVKCTGTLEGTGMPTLYMGEYIDLMEDGQTYAYNTPSTRGTMRVENLDGNTTWTGEVTVDKATIVSIQPYIQWAVDAFPAGGTTVYPMLNKGDTVLPWEPYTGGNPSPSPEYPQELESVGTYNEETDNWECMLLQCRDNLLPYTINRQMDIYTSYQPNTLLLTADQPWRRLGDIRDTVEDRDGVLGTWRRCIEWSGTIINKFKDAENTISYHIDFCPVQVIGGSQAVGKCNRLEWGYNNTDTVHYHTFDIGRSARVFLPKDYTPVVSDFTFVSVLAEPIWEPFPEEVQEQYRNLRSYAGTTHTWAEDPLQPIVTIRYIKDSNIVLSELTDRLAALESSITQTATAFTYLPEDIQAEMIANETNNLLQSQEVSQ